MARNLGVECTYEGAFYFLSYDSDDSGRVLGYVNALNSHQIPIWYDKGEKVGDDWEFELADKIDKCSAVIMFISANILDKDKTRVQKEFRLATEYSGKTVYIMMLDNVKKADVPIRFEAWWDDVCNSGNIIECDKNTETEKVEILLNALDKKQ